MWVVAYKYITGVAMDGERIKCKKCAAMLKPKFLQGHMTTAHQGKDPKQREDGEA